MGANNFGGLLTTIDNRNLVDKVEMKLIEIFIKNELKPGDSIPKETDLAEAMGVSRTVIRESLNRLKTIDIIESKKHKGTMIKSPRIFDIFKKSMIPNILSDRTLRDIFELRLIIEIGLSDFICQRITKNDIACLAEIVRIEPEKSRTIHFDIEYEMKFHSKLYEITGNNSVIQFLSLLLPIFNYAYISGLISTPIISKRRVSHKDLLEVLKKKDSENFRNAMRAHLEYHFQRILYIDGK